MLGRIPLAQFCTRCTGDTTARIFWYHKQQCSPRFAWPQSESTAARVGCDCLPARLQSNHVVCREVIIGVIFLHREGLEATSVVRHVLQRQTVSLCSLHCGAFFKFVPCQLLCAGGRKTAREKKGKEPLSERGQRICRSSPEDTELHARNTSWKCTARRCRAAAHAQIRRQRFLMFARQHQAGPPCPGRQSVFTVNAADFQQLHLKQTLDTTNLSMRTGLLLMKTYRYCHNSNIFCPLFVCCLFSVFKYVSLHCSGLV